jgi:hypothetical protein
MYHTWGKKQHMHNCGNKSARGRGCLDKGGLSGHKLDSHNIGKLIKSRRVRWTVYVVCLSVHCWLENTYRVLVRKFVGKRDHIIVQALTGDENSCVSGGGLNSTGLWLRPVEVSFEHGNESLG